MNIDSTFVLLWIHAHNFTFTLISFVHPFIFCTLMQVAFVACLYVLECGYSFLNQLNHL